ncbi:MAG: Nif11-like leader peptide family natural product precursor [Synechococcaceae cyanobacterium]
MATCNLPAPEVEHPSAAALHQLKEMLQGDPAFAQALRATESTQAAAGLVAEHGIAVTPEALWRHRGTLVSGGLPTWRG